MKLKFLFVFLCFYLTSFSQTDSVEIEIKHFQEELNRSYKDKKETPLRGENIRKFSKHPFFPIDLQYRVLAKIVRVKKPVPFELPTSSGKSRWYQEYALVTFQYKGNPYSLKIYQSLELMKTPKYKNHLFLPFRDETNGVDTYGGGKYLDLEIPATDEILIDFNQSYHPYCAYNAYDFSCPIVPEENKLPFRVEAGVMYEDIWFEH